MGSINLNVQEGGDDRRIREKKQRDVLVIAETVMIYEIKQRTDRVNYDYKDISVSKHRLRKVEDKLTSGERCTGRPKGLVEKVTGEHNCC